MKVEKSVKLRRKQKTWELLVFDQQPRSITNVVHGRFLNRGSGPFSKRAKNVTQ